MNHIKKLTVFVSIIVMFGGCGKSTTYPTINTPPEKYPKPSPDEAKANEEFLRKWDELGLVRQDSRQQNLEAKVNVLKRIQDERRQLDLDGCSLGFKMAVHEHNTAYREFISYIQDISVPVEIANALGDIFINGQSPGAYTGRKEQELNNLITRIEKSRIVMEHSVKNAYP